MGIKEIASRMFVNFFVIFFLIMVVLSVPSWFMGADTISLNAVFSTMALSFLIVLTEFVFYSKKELTRLEWLVRHLICLLLVTAIVMLFMFFSGASFDEPSTLIESVIAVFIIYPISFAIDYFRTVKSTNQLAKKLKERYRQN